MIQELLRKDELLPLFKKYAQGYKEGIALDQPLMTINELRKFFKGEQGQEI